MAIDEIVLGTPYLESQKQKLENIRLDDLAPEPDRRALLQKLVVAADDGEAGPTYIEYCKDGRRLLGPPPAAAVGDAEGLGHLMRAIPFQRRVSRHTGADEAIIQAVIDMAFGTAPIVAVTPEEADELLSVAINDLLVNDEDLFYLFRHPADPANPFNQNIGKLPWLLGIRATSGARFIGFSALGAACPDAKIPTCFDNHWSALDLWRPGGQTCPHGVCSPDQGLPELVARPIAIGDGNGPLTWVQAE